MFARSVEKEKKMLNDDQKMFLHQILDEIEGLRLMEKRRGKLKRHLYTVMMCDKDIEEVERQIAANGQDIHHQKKYIYKLLAQRMENFEVPQILEINND